MLNLNKSYQENILNPQYQYYEQFVDAIIENGKLDDRYTLLLDADKVQDIVILALLKMLQNFPEDSRNISQGHHIKMNNIGNFAASLGHDAIFSIAKSFGLNNVIDMHLDETEPFKSVLEIENEKHMNRLLSLKEAQDIVEKKKEDRIKEKAEQKLIEIGKKNWEKKFNTNNKLLNK